MTDKNPKQDNKTRKFNVPAHEYDQKLIKKFLKTVFHTELSLANVCGYAKTGSKPGFPANGEEVVKRLNGTLPAMPCYFGTATMNMDERDERLYNRQSNMRAMHVVVLDDIGTKVPKGKMPKGLDPTYKIETSPGNEQWGLVLETPITDVEEAALLIKLVYSSGYTDSGGALCNKIVRLPAGINGKDSDTGSFPVKLIDMNGPYFTPQEILDVLGTELEWDHLKADPELVKRQLRRQAGATQFSPVKLRGETTEGVTDVVLEWFYERNEVLQESADWFTIVCPWAHEHSTGDGTAGYSPLGYGGQFASSRGFHCFHEHCQARKGKDLLDWVATVGGPQAAAYDPGYALVSEIVYDVSNDNVYNVKVDNYLDQRTNGFGKSSFSAVYPGKVEVELGSGHTFKHSLFDMWTRHPSRVLVHGTVSDPTGGLVVGSNPKFQQLNIFQMPEYKRRACKPETIAPFMAFLDYLIPDALERAYFLDWLACKAQNLRFRGNAIVMVAEEEGTGRGTLSKIIGRVFGQNNLYNAEFSQIIGAQFNPFMRALFVTCDETLMARGEKAKEESYERLKGLIEPSETAITVNEKNMKQYTVLGGPSFLFFSNHSDALYMKGHARRFYIIQNPPAPRHPNGKPDPARFDAIYDWIDGKGWETELWNYLLDREVDEKMMMMPAPETNGKLKMREQSGSEAEKALRAILHCWPSDLIMPAKIKDMMFNLGLRISTDYNWGTAFRPNKRNYMTCPRTVKKGNPIAYNQRIDGKVVRVNVKNTAAEALLHSEDPGIALARAKADLEKIVEGNLFQKIEDEAALILDIH